MGTLTLQDPVGQCHFQVKSNLNMSKQGKSFEQRYYRNLNILSLCRLLLISGNFQSEHVAAAEIVLNNDIIETLIH